MAETITTIYLILSHGRILPEIVTLSPDEIVLNKFSDRTELREYLSTQIIAPVPFPFYKRTNKNTKRQKLKHSKSEMEDLDKVLSEISMDESPFELTDFSPEDLAHLQSYILQTDTETGKKSSLKSVVKINVAGFNCPNYMSNDDREKVKQTLNTGALDLSLKPKIVRQMQKADIVYKQCRENEHWMLEMLNHDTKDWEAIEFWNQILQPNMSIDAWSDDDDDEDDVGKKEDISEYCKSLPYKFNSWEYDADAADHGADSSTTTEPAKNKIIFFNKMYSSDEDAPIYKLDNSKWVKAFEGQKMTTYKIITDTIEEDPTKNHKIMIIDYSCSNHCGDLPSANFLTDKECSSDICGTFDNKKCIRYGGKSKKRTSKKRTSKKRTSKKRTSKKRTSKKRTSKKRNIK